MKILIYAFTLIFSLFIYSSFANATTKSQKRCGVSPLKYGTYMSTTIQNNSSQHVSLIYKITHGSKSTWFYNPSTTPHNSIPLSLAPGQKIHFNICRSTSVTQGNAKILVKVNGSTTCELMTNIYSNYYSTEKIIPLTATEVQCKLNSQGNHIMLTLY